MACQLWWGAAGLMAGVLLGALADLHAAAAAVLVQGPPDAAPAALLHALMGALLVHNLSKCVTGGAQRRTGLPAGLCARAGGPHRRWCWGCWHGAGAA
jgi:hypothetical protein